MELNVARPALGRDAWPNDQFIRRQPSRGRLGYMPGLAKRPAIV